MKNIITKLAGVGILGVVLASPTVTHAISLTVTPTYGTTTSISITTPSDTGSKSKTVKVTQLEAVGPGTSFYAFCSDINLALLSSSASYTEITPIPDPAPDAAVNPNWVAGGAIKASWLYVANNGGSLLSQATGAALQLAIWNVLYDGDADILNGVFKANSGGAIQTAAQDMLNGLAGADFSNISGSWWKPGAVDRKTTQSLITGKRIPTTNVPAPVGFAGISLLMVAGLQLVRNRKR